jgi:hypothetical protein
MEPIVLPLILAAGGGFIALIVYLVNREQEKNRRAWTEAAARVGGAFDPSAGPWYRRTMTIQATLDGVAVLADYYVVSNGKSSTTYTRVRAAAAGAPNLRLSVYKEGFFSSLGKALGTQDIQVGDPLFDDLFMVKSNDEALCRAWLNAGARQALLAAAAYSFALKDGEVTATRVGLERDPELFAAAMRATAALAAGGRALLGGWRAAAAALGAQARGLASALAPGESALEWESRGVHVTFELAQDDLGGVFQRSTRSYTRVRARHRGEGEVFALYSGAPPHPAQALPKAALEDAGLAARYELRAEDASRAALRLGAAASRLARLSPLAVLSDAQFVSVLVDGVLSDPEAFRLAGELAAALAAAPTSGPYR